MEKNNYKKLDAGCDKYGKQRLELAVYLKQNILNSLNSPWFIENGTLLGAWRNGKFIAHDDDFDYAILINNRNEINDIYEKIKNSLINSKYKSRLISTYSDKIEVYDKSYGKYYLLGKQYNNNDYHYVTIDLQFYIKENEKYTKLYYANPFTYTFNNNTILPLTSIILENESFNAPAKIEQFLVENYGSLSPNASYNAKTGLYEL